MPIEHTNRKGRTYYLHCGQTKSGKPKYYLSMKREGAFEGNLPEGFEIYENPEAQVFVRKVLPKLISDEEVEVVERELNRIAELRGSKVERKLKLLEIYVVGQRQEWLDELREMFILRGEADFEFLLSEAISYSPQLQFVLIDPKKRIFQTRRYCYLGSIDDWIDIGSSGSLATLARRYVKHIGQDSYFELF